LADESSRPDFEQALGETFGEFVSPPIPYEDASPHECCEVVWSVVGRNVTPSRLATLDEQEIAALARKFGKYFGCGSPGVEQVKEAIVHTLARWPVGSLGESAESGAGADGGA
jgi:hypothetical protein